MSAQFSIGTFSQSVQRPFPGIIIGDRIYATESIAAGRWRSTLELFEDWEEAFTILSHFASAPAGASFSLADVEYHVPVSPRQIICAGANYRKHVVDLIYDHEAPNYPNLSDEERRQLAQRIMDHRAAEGQPFAFVKPYSCLLAPFDTLTIPNDSDEVDWELELAAVIGKSARRVSRENALNYVAGYSVVNDISSRDHIRRPDFPGLGLDWLACKGKPGFLPFGPTILPAAFVPDPQNMLVTLTLNGQVMQNESTSEMIFGVARIIEFLSIHLQLLPGDIVCTGSPSGNGTHHKRFLRPGDVMEGTVAGLGTQRITCVAEADASGAPQHRPFAPLVLA